MGYLVSYTVGCERRSRIPCTRDTPLYGHLGDVKEVVEVIRKCEPTAKIFDEIGCTLQQNRVVIVEVLSSSKPSIF